MLSLGVAYLMANSFAVAQTANAVNGYEYVDLGLSVKWATCDVGATSPWECGHYFAWGETEGEKNLADFEKTHIQVSVSGDNTHWHWGDVIEMIGTCATFSVEMDDISGDQEFDAAKANWGDSWRMPTFDEWNELFTNCKLEYVDKGDIKGFTAVSKKNGNSIFFSFGIAYGEDIALSARYWTSTPIFESPYDDAISVIIYTDDISENWGWRISKESRFWGMHIRPVTD